MIFDPQLAAAATVHTAQPLSPAHLEEALDQYKATLGDTDKPEPEIDDTPYWSVAEKILSPKKGDDGDRENPDPVRKVAQAYIDYGENIGAIEFEEQQAALKGTIAGRIGWFLEGITRTIGFDYRTNIALVGGFAAKEVVISTLGTAYSLGEVDPEQSGPLSGKLRKDPNWNPLLAFTLIVFTMLYVPCLPTVISIKKESSWRWAGFSIAFNLLAAYSACLLVYQVGLALGLGI